MDLCISRPYHSVASCVSTCPASPCAGLRVHQRGLLSRLCRHRFAPVGDPAFRHVCTYRARRRFPTHPFVPVPLTDTQAAEVATITRPDGGTPWHRSSRWEPTHSVQRLGFNQFRLNHIARVWQHDSAAFSACSCPVRLSISGKPMTQRRPSESLPAVRGIQACVTRRTRAVGLRPTVLLLPFLMSLHEQGFDDFPVLACL